MSDDRQDDDGSSYSYSGARPQSILSSAAFLRQLLLREDDPDTDAFLDILRLQVASRQGEEEENDEDYEDEDEDPYDGPNYAQEPFFPPVIEPKKEGLELLMSGEFGRVGNKMRARQDRFDLPMSVRAQRATQRPSVFKEDYNYSLIPNTNGTAVASYTANVYTGQYSQDSSFYYTCSQDFELHIYDTTKPLASHAQYNAATRQSSYRGAGRDSVQTRMPIKQSIQGQYGNWTITDANLSPDNERMIYSTISPDVYMTKTNDPDPEQTLISFRDGQQSRRGRGWLSGSDFGIWSCKFSADGNEVVAGGHGKIFVYDLLADRRTVKIEAHQADVNSCCWADTASGNVLISGSDDSFVKVWDRRSLGASAKPSGVLAGHTEGITYVSAKGDGRYIISNGKDQSLRLWDLRKMHSSDDFDTFKHKSYSTNFDYRYPPFPRPKWLAHPKDCSVMTFRGHSVMRTLIRCHFSPAETTGQQYIYSGSADGQIHIWSLDGRVVQVLDRSQTMDMAFDPSDPELPKRKGRNPCMVRDVSWHTYQPILMSAGWENRMSGSTVAQHHWKGLSKMRYNLEDWVEQQEAEATETAAIRRHMPGYMAMDTDSDPEDEDYIFSDDE